MEGGVQGRGECRVPDRYRRRVRTPREQGGSQEELRGLPQRPAGAARERLEDQGEARPARGFSPGDACSARTGTDASRRGGRGEGGTNAAAAWTRSISSNGAIRREGQGGS